MDILSARVVSHFVSRLGYDSPSVLCLLWPPNKKKSCAVNVGGHCLSWGPTAWRVSIRCDSRHFTWRFCTLHSDDKPWAFVPSPVSRCLGELKDLTLSVKTR